MSNTIKLKRGSGSDPSASDLVVGELAIRTDSGKIFTKKDNGTVAEISGGGGISDGDKGDITVSNGGDTFSIDNNVITNAMVQGAAAIAGTKISPDFGNQTVLAGLVNAPVLKTQGASGSGDGIILLNSGGGQNNDFSRIRQAIADDSFIIENKSSGAYESFFKGNSDRGAELHFQGSKKLETLTGGVSITGSLTTSGTFASGNQTITATAPSIQFTDSNNSPNYQIKVDLGAFAIKDASAGANRFTIDASKIVSVLNHDFSSGIDVTGNITVSGTVDGRDLATDGAKLDGGVMLVDEDKGDITVSNSGQTFTIDNGVVTGNKIAADTITASNLNTGSGAEAVTTSTIRDGAVTTQKIANGTIVNEDVSASASISGLKVAPSFGNQDVITTGTLSSGALSVNTGTGNTCATFTSTDAGAVINITDNSARSSIEQNGTDLKIISDTDGGDANSTIKFQVDASTKMTLDSSGRLGIGTASPSVLLDLESTSPTIKFTDSDASGTPECEISGAGGDLVLSADKDDEKASTQILLKTDGATRLTIAESAVDISSGDLQIGGTTVLNSSRALYNLDSIKLADNKVAKFGSSDDLKIYHDGSNSYIQDDGTGELRLRGTTIRLTDNDGSESFAIFNDNGSVQLYHNNNLKFQTNSNGCRFVGTLAGIDDEKVALGTGNDLQLYHDGSNSYITNAVGDLIFQHGSENLMQLKDDGAVELYYDNSNKLQTTSSGVNVTGDITLTATQPAISFIDDGQNPDYKLYNNNGTLRLYDITNTSDRLVVNSDGHVDVTGHLDVGAGLDVTGVGTFDGGTSNATNDATLYVTATNNNDWGLKINKYNGSATEYGARIQVASGSTYALQVTGNGSEVFRIQGNGNVVLSGTVDGRDVAADGSKLDGIASGATNVTNTNQLTNGAGFLTSVGTSNISNDAVTFAKMQNIAQNSILARLDSGSGDIQELSASQIRGILNVANGATNVTNNNQLTNGAGYTTFDGNYNSLSNRPTIPTNNNQLTNGAGYITASQVSSAPAAAKKWVVFSSGTIQDDEGISSITYHSTGQYTINFDGNMANTNYSVQGFAFRNGAGRILVHVDTYSTYTTSALRIMVSGGNNTGSVGLVTVNPNKVNIAIWGDT